MTPPLKPDLKNPQHAELISAWDEAARRYNAMNEWFKANPPKQPNLPFYEWPEEEQEARKTEVKAARKALGLPESELAPGQVVTDDFNYVFTYKLRKALRDDDDNILINRMSQCKHCAAVFFSNRPKPFCSEECKEASKADRKERETQRRRESRATLSEALKTRQGVCLSCGATFTIKRTSGKTCSAKCRQNLTRKGAQFTPDTMELPMTPETYQGKRQQFDELYDLRMKVFCCAISGEPLPDGVPGVEAITHQVQALEREMEPYDAAMEWNTICNAAPALAIWIERQPEETRQQILNLETAESLQALGTNLRKLARESH